MRRTLLYAGLVCWQTSVSSATAEGPAAERAGGAGAFRHRACPEMPANQVPDLYVETDAMYRRFAAPKV
jgi:hypothetical protein